MKYNMDIAMIEMVCYNNSRSVGESHSSAKRFLSRERRPTMNTLHRVFFAFLVGKTYSLSVVKKEIDRTVKSVVSFKFVYALLLYSVLAVRV